MQLIPVGCHQFKTEQVTIKGKRPVEVGDFQVDVTYSGLRWYGIVRCHHSMLRNKKYHVHLIKLRDTEYLMLPCWLFVWLPGSLPFARQTPIRLSPRTSGLANNLSCVSVSESARSRPEKTETQSPLLFQARQTQKHNFSRLEVSGVPTAFVALSEFSFNNNRNAAGNTQYNCR